VIQREEPSLDLDASGRASGERQTEAAAPTIRAKFRPSRAMMQLVAAVPATHQKAAPRAPVARGAQMLAMAHEVERLVEAGEVPSYAHAARALGLTRARLTQLMNLLLLSPAVQERVLAEELGATERSLRRLVGEPEWGVRQEHLRSSHPSQPA